MDSYVVKILQDYFNTTSGGQKLQFLKEKYYADKISERNYYVAEISHFAGISQKTIETNIVEVLKMTSTIFTQFHVNNDIVLASVKTVIVDFNNADNGVQFDKTNNYHTNNVMITVFNKLNGLGIDSRTIAYNVNKVMFG